MSEQKALVHNTCATSIAVSSSRIGTNHVPSLPSPKDSNPWKEGSRIYSVTLENDMAVNMALSKGQNNPGRWATFDNIPDVDYVRNNLAVTPQFKNDISYVQGYIIPKGTRVQIGIVGPQTYEGVTYSGGGTQIQILSLPSSRSLIPSGKRRDIF